MVSVMSDEQLKAAEAEATAQVEENVEEISEEDLAGVAGGGGYLPPANASVQNNPGGVRIA